MNLVAVVMVWDTATRPPLIRCPKPVPHGTHDWLNKQPGPNPDYGALSVCPGLMTIPITKIEELLNGT